MVNKAKASGTESLLRKTTFLSHLCRFSFLSEPQPGGISGKHPFVIWFCSFLNSSSALMFIIGLSSFLLKSIHIAKNDASHRCCFLSDWSVIIDAPQN